MELHEPVGLTLFGVYDFAFGKKGIPGSFPISECEAG
jgi:hypothetical protein